MPLLANENRQAEHAGYVSGVLSASDGPSTDVDDAGGENRGAGERRKVVGELLARLEAPPAAGLTAWGAADRRSVLRASAICARTVPGSGARSRRSSSRSKTGAA